MDAPQFSELLAVLWEIGAMIGGFILALIFAVTWKG